MRLQDHDTMTSQQCSMRPWDYKTMIPRLHNTTTLQHAIMRLQHHDTTTSQHHNTAACDHETTRPWYHDITTLQHPIMRLQNHDTTTSQHHNTAACDHETTRPLDDTLSHCKHIKYYLWPSRLKSYMPTNDTSTSTLISHMQSHLYTLYECCTCMIQLIAH